MDKYILQGKVAIPEPDVQKWAKWFEKADRRVKVTHVGDTMISTVFLGIDHSFGQLGPPLLFETMVFIGDGDGDMNRYPTWKLAEQGHDEMVKRIHEYYDPVKDQEIDL